MIFRSVTISLPKWVQDTFGNAHKPYPEIEDRMALIIRLSRMNVEQRTGGPFAAGIFDLESFMPVSVGINMVTTLHCSVLHAEMVAVIMAQQAYKTHDLGDPSIPPLEIVISTEPCGMCLGGIIWSGISRMVCGAKGKDAEAIGFDEGPKPQNWPRALADRHISVVQDVLRKDAAAVLKDYRDSGGIIYNPSRQLPG